MTKYNIEVKWEKESQENGIDYKNNLGIWSHTYLHFFFFFSYDMDKIGLELFIQNIIFL